MLKIPAFIEVLAIQGAKPDFKSDLVSVNRVFDAEIPAVLGATYEASERSKLAFGAAQVEWVAWRLDGVVDVKDLLHFAEALWASTIDYRYAREIEHPTPESDAGMAHVLHGAWQKGNALALLCPRGKGKPNNCVWLSSLARYVTPKAKQAAYKQWLEAVLGRMQEHWPMSSTEKGADVRQGDPVPREAFDPGFDYSPKQDAKLLAAFLASLDAKSNPYLRSAADMKQAGFTGTPYQL